MAKDSDCCACDEWRDLAYAWKTTSGQWREHADRWRRHAEGWQLQYEAAEAEAKALRYEVAQEMGVPQELRSFLTGNSRKEIEEQADAVLAQVNDESTKPVEMSVEDDDWVSEFVEDPKVQQFLHSVTSEDLDRAADDIAPQSPIRAKSFPPTKAYKPPHGFVYFVVPEGRSDRVKIGATSRTVKDRLTEMQNGAPDRLEVLHLIELNGQDPFELERELHNRWADVRMHGEWFRREGDLEAFLRAEATVASACPAT